jgi:biotin carboxyl carrier protein
MKMTLQLGDQRQDLRVLRNGDRITVTLDDGRLLAARVERHDDGAFTVLHGGRRLECAGAVTGAERQLWLDGRTLRYRRGDVPVARNHRSEPLPTASAIPAVVREVLVAPGDLVAAGQKLLLLESMKMVLPIVASRAGRVRTILCAPGDAVAPGVTLVDIADD